MNKQVSTAKIYLGTPFYNDDQRARVDKARALLEENRQWSECIFHLIKILLIRMKRILKLVAFAA